MSKTDKQKATIPVMRKLEVDKNWNVEIPLDLREKFPSTPNKEVYVYFTFADEEALFDALIENLTHEGVLIATNFE